MLNWLALLILLALAIVTKPLRTIPKGHRGVRRFMGRVTDVCGPGRTLVLPFVEELTVVDQRIKIARFAVDQTLPGKEKKQLEATVSYRVVDPIKAFDSVERIQERTLPSSLREAVNELTPGFDPNEADSLGGRFALKIRRNVQKKLLPVGVAIDRVVFTQG